MNKEERCQIIAVDFDGTLCRECYPDIGEPNQELIQWLIEERAHGSRIILWTCRCGVLLTEAVLWCGERGLYFDEVNENMKEIRRQYGSNARKIFADIYIDDRACSPEYWKWLKKQKNNMEGRQ